MEELKERTVEFKFDGVTYKIKLFKVSDKKYIVRAFRDDKPANSYSYHAENIDFDGDEAFINKHVKPLIDIARSDIENKIWEKNQAAIEAINDDKNPE